MAISIWLRRSGDSPDTPPVLITHEDTLKRCLSEGWTEVEMPAVPDSIDPAPDPIDPAPKRATRKPEKREA